MIACVEYNHIRLIELLLQKGADVNFRSANGNTPLLTAIRTENMALARMLIANDAKINYPTDGDHTPLTLACSIGNMDFVNMLLRQGAELELRTANGETPLIMACKMRNMDLIRKLLEFGSEINYPRDARYTPLIAACMFGEVDMVSLLLSKGAVIDMPNIKRGTPLAAAAKRGQADIVELLLDHLMENNLPIDVTGVSGATPVHKAAARGHGTVVQMLVDQGASIYLADSKGDTAVVEAARRHHADVLRYLIEQGADVDFPGHDGHTVRQFAQGDERLAAALREGLLTFERTLRGPILGLHAGGNVNDNDPVRDGFYFESESVPVTNRSRVRWGQLLDPRSFPLQTLDGVIIVLDARRDRHLKAAIGRAEALMRIFSDAHGRASALAMVVAGECGGAALSSKLALARSELARVRTRASSDILAVGDLLPSFSMDRTRAVLFKYLLGKMNWFEATPIWCRIVSRPSSGSGWDQRQSAWPRNFTWIEIAFDRIGPYYIVDQMWSPGALLIETSPEAARYRSGDVFHDLQISSTSSPFDQVSARDQIDRVIRQTSPDRSGVKRSPMRSKRNRRRRGPSVSSLDSVAAGGNSGTGLDPDAEGVDPDIAPASPPLSQLAEGDSHQPKSEISQIAETTISAEDGKNNGDETDTAGTSTTPDVPGPSSTVPAAIAQQLEQEEDGLARDGRVQWDGDWSGRSVTVVRYPVPMFFNDQQRDQARSLFRQDIQVFESLRHRCIERPIAVDYQSRSLIWTIPEGYTRLDDYIRHLGASLDMNSRLSIVLQLAETMEYLHSRPEPIIHGRLRLKHIFIEDIGEEPSQSPPLSTSPNPLVRLLDVGLPRRLEPILLKQNPFDGAAVYYTPERLRLDQPEGEGGNETSNADVYAFGIIAVFVASGDLPWSDFQAEDLRRFYGEGRRPGLQDDMGLGQCQSWKPVLERILEPDPERRPTFTQVIRLFQQHVPICWRS